MILRVKLNKYNSEKILDIIFEEKFTYFSHTIQVRSQFTRIITSRVP